MQSTLSCKCHGDWTPTSAKAIYGICKSSEYAVCTQHIFDTNWHSVQFVRNYASEL